jgi:hypothetical protein
VAEIAPELLTDENLLARSWNLGANNGKQCFLVMRYLPHVLPQKRMHRSPDDGKVQDHFLQSNENLSGPVFGALQRSWNVIKLG